MSEPFVLDSPGSGRVSPPTLALGTTTGGERCGGGWGKKGGLSNRLVMKVTCRQILDYRLSVDREIIQQLQ